LGSGLLLLTYNCDRKIDLGFAAKILQEADKEMTAIKFVLDGLGVALMPELITGLSHEGTVFLPLSPPFLRGQPTPGAPTIPPSRSRITFKS
jgi:DNA-binding transcriptional LysR family regulator